MAVTGCCGLDCGACEANLATKANDRAALVALAEKWSALYHTEMQADGRGATLRGARQNRRRLARRVSGARLALGRGRRTAGRALITAAR